MKEKQKEECKNQQLSKDFYNIPEKIKIGNITYRIILKDLKNKCLGDHKVTCKKGPRIRIEEKLTPELMENVLYHELTHAILFQSGFDDPEMITQGIANILQNMFSIKQNNEYS